MCSHMTPHQQTRRGACGMDSLDTSGRECDGVRGPRDRGQSRKSAVPLLRGARHWAKTSEHAAAVEQAEAACDHSRASGECQDALRNDERRPNGSGVGE